MSAFAQATFLVFVFLSVSAKSVVPIDENRLSMGRGVEVPLGKYPYLVSVQNNPPYHGCLGAALNKHWILIPETCVSTVPEDFYYLKGLRVISGTVKFNNEENPARKEHYIKNLISYPNNTGLNDNVALVEIHPSLHRVKQFAKLPSVGQQVAVDTSGLAVYVNGNSTNFRIREENSTVVSYGECLKTSDKTFDYICSLTEFPYATCFEGGNIGAPYLVNGTMFGFLWKPGCWNIPNTDNIDAYIDLSRYVEWIDATIKPCIKFFQNNRFLK